MRKIIVCLLLISFKFNQGYCQPLDQVLPKNNSVIEGESVFFQWNHTYSDTNPFILEISTDSLFSNIVISAFTYRNDTSLALPFGTYWWRVRQGSLYSNSNNKLTIFTPEKLTNKLAAWYDFDSTFSQSNLVDSLYDLSGNNNFAFNNESIFRKPLINIDSSLNNNKVCFFDGDDYLNTNYTINSNSGFYAIALAKNSSSDNNSARYIYDQGNAANSGSGLAISNEKYYTYTPLSYGGSRITKTPITEVNNFIVITQQVDFNDSLSLFINSTLDSSVSITLSGFNSNITSSNPLRLGMTSKNIDYTRTFNGTVSEIIFIKDTLLTRESLNTINNYLFFKHAPPVNLGVDINRDFSICNLDYISPVNYNKYVSYLWSTGDTTNQIPFANGTFWIEVEDIFGIKSRDTIVISGQEFQSISLDSVICHENTPFTINPVTHSKYFKFLWQDNSTDSVFILNNSENISLIIVDYIGCKEIINQQITIDSFSVNNSLGMDSSRCSNEILSLNNYTDSNGLYLWSTGDTTPSITLLNTDSYWVQAYNQNNCFIEDTTLITIKGITPFVDFTIDSPCRNSNVLIDNLSTTTQPDSIKFYSWNFGNNDSSSLEVPNYAYNNAGSYQISLTVETDSGCVNDITKTIEVKDLPNANFNFGINCALTQSQFFDASTITSPDSITQWEWGINNSLLIDKNPITTFGSAGIKTVFLKATASNGCTDTITKTIEVYPALLPDFETDNVCIGDSTTFTDITPSYSTISRLWNFGGGQFSADTMPTVLFSDTGTYSVTLQVENAIGCQNVITKTVKINPLPIASATLDNICENSLSLFYNTSNATINNFEWLINSTPYTSDSVLLSFNTAGNYPVYHKITDINGCEDDTSFSFTIRPNPNVDFNFNPTFGQAPLLVNFQNQTDSATLNTWNFGENNQQSNDVNPSYTYTENGVYNVTLIAENQYGCKDSMLKIINVSPTDLDVELSNLDYQIITLANGDIAYVPQLTLSNVGTRTIYNFDIYVSIDEEKNISEHWQGTLNVGESMQYIFQSYFIISDEATINYMCAEAKNTNDNTEDLLNNNKSCIVLNGKLKTSKIYPNPTNSNANIDIISKNKGNINVGVYDMAGKKVYNAENVAIQKGYNQIVIDCVHLQIGKYIVNITHQGEIYQLTFWVNH